MRKDQYTYYVYTDGACSGNPGAGGWGALIESPDGTVTELSSGYRLTTNNRMELRAVIAGLAHTPASVTVVVTTDSQYVVNAIEKGWLVNWQRNHWRNAQKKPVANKDLWELLDSELHKREVSFRWIRGHQGHVQNERCDALAVAQYQKPTSNEDEGYERETIIPF